MKKILLMLCVLAFHWTNAQVTQPLPKYKYLYSLGVEDVIAYREGSFKPYPLIQNSIPADSLLLAENAHSYLRAKRKNGYFLIVEYLSSGPSISMLQVSNVSLAAYIVGDHWQVYLFDSSGFLPDFKIQAQKEEYHLKKQCQCVEEKGKKLPKKAMVVYYPGGFFVLRSGDFSTQAATSPVISYYRSRRWFVKRHSPFEPGFIMLNQSEFRHHDSLYAKAFLMNRKGRPYKGKVMVDVYLYTGNKPYRITVPAKFYGAGSYGFEWQVPDSLQLDQQYTLQFMAERHPRIAKSINFNITHYTYQNQKLNARLSKPFFLPGDSSFVILSALDQNDIPIAGTKAEINFRIYSTGMLHTSYLSLHDSLFSHLRDTTLYLEPEKETWIRIPDELLRSIDHHVQVRIRMTTPDNNFQDLILNIEGLNFKEEYTYRFDGEQAKLEYLLNDKSTVSDSVTIRLIDRYFFEAQTISTVLPYTLEKASKYSSIQVYGRGNKLLLHFVGQNYPVRVSGTKTKDSLYVAFENGHYNHLNWEILHRGKRIMSGQEDSVRMFLPGDEAVEVRYRYLEGSLMHYKQEMILPAVQTLVLKHNLPEIAYPGQKIIVEIQLSDFNGKPVKNGNITATSINGQMPVILPPSIPFFPKKQSKITPLKSLSQQAPAFSRHNYLASDTLVYDGFELGKILHYRVYYPKEGLSHVEVPSGDSGTYLQVAVEHRHVTQWPREIWVNGELRYLILNMDRHRPVIKLNAGTYKIGIRTENYFIELDSVSISKGKHHILGIQTERLEINPFLSYQKVGAEYEIQELEKIEENVLFLYSRGLRGPLFLRQGDQYFEMQSDNYAYRTQSIYQSYHSIAPLKEGMVSLLSRDTIVTFYFDPSFLYSLDSGRVSSTYKNQPGLMHARLANLPGYLVDKDALGLAEIHQVWHQMDSLDSLNALPRPVQPVNQNVPASFTPYYGYGGSATLQLMHDTSFPIEPNFIWLVNTAQPQYSLYLNQYSNQFSQLKSGWYHLVIGKYEQEMLEVDSIYIDSLHRTYLRLDKLCRPLEAKNWVKLKYDYYQTLLIHGKVKTPLYDAYLQTRENPSQFKKASVNGNVFINLNPGVNSYVVFIHEDGKTRYLSIANHQGSFQEYDMIPGRYLVQVISSSRQVFFSRGVTLRAEKLLNLQLDCVTDTGFLKKISARIDYRKFDKKKAKYLESDRPFANIQGQLINKKDNKPLNHAQVKVVLNGIVVGGALTDGRGQYSICCLQEGEYTLEFIANGFQMISIENSLLRNQHILQMDLELDPAENSSWTTYMWTFGDGVAPEQEEGRAFLEMNSFAAPQRNLAPIQTDNLYLESEVIATSKKNRVANIGISNRAGHSGIEVVDDAIKEKQRLDEISQDPDANKIRSNFKSNAFWMPHLVTNKAGKTGFTYTLPDDETRWIHFIAAINRKRQTVLDISYTRSFKPMSVSLRVPEFVYVGDSIQFAASLRDLTGDSSQIQVVKDFGNGIQANPLTLKKYFRDSQWLKVQGGLDSLKLRYSLKYGNYIDGEARQFPVYSNLIFDRKVQTRIMEKSERTILLFDSAAFRKTVRIESGLKDLMLEEIGRLKQYQYGCNEQTASKLIALVWEERLLKHLGQKTDNRDEINKLIKRLERHQNQDGGWGWAENSSSQIPLTLYLCKALILADEAGYSNHHAKKALGNLVNRLNAMDPEAQLQTILLAHAIGLKYDFKAFIEQAEKKNFSLEARFSLIELQQKLKLSPDLGPVLSALKTDMQGARYVSGTSHWGFNSAVMSLTTQAYSILKTAGGFANELKGIRYFIFNHLGYVQRNTFERAQIIHVLASEVIEEQGALISVKVDGKLIQSSSEILVTGSRIEIENQGAGVSVIAIEEFLSEGKQPVNYGVEVRSHFTGDSARHLRVSAGKVETLRVQVTTSKFQQYLVMEVPVPSGFQMVSKPTALGREVAREYFPDRVVIYFESLPKGRYFFDFYLLPQFNGKLTLMPAFMENMYEPEFYGRECRKQVVVE
ncbi:MAG: hypothetical protein LPK45_08570 [Bacteroidota bacterium]|nr:hypothetical protein [Bacteroidota bacterium]MDX5431127.1 hypothetical protein [Bacteroidota bacterium]MDX5469876.1 hypothetical protein [Bacteroidota bacterium]